MLDSTLYRYMCSMRNVARGSSDRRTNLTLTFDELDRICKVLANDDLVGKSFAIGECIIFRSRHVRTVLDYSIERQYILLQGPPLDSFETEGIISGWKVEIQTEIDP